MIIILFLFLTFASDTVLTALSSAIPRNVDEPTITVLPHTTTSLFLFLRPSFPPLFMLSSFNLILRYKMADLEKGAVNQLRGRLAMVEFERRVVPSRGLDGIFNLKKNSNTITTLSKKLKINN